MVGTEDKSGTGRTTLSQVAAACGVSTGAVSLALNRSLEASRLRPETHGRIRKVAAEMGYRADWRGRALSKGRIHSVGLLSARMTPHVTDVYEQMYDVVAETLTARGYHMHFIPAVGGPEKWREIVEDQRVEGCLVVPPMPADLPMTLRALGMPAVLLNIKTDEPLPQFLPDDIQGTRLVADHLFQLGHRKICLAMSPGSDTHHSADDRSAAFAAFASEHGMAGTCDTRIVPPAELAADVRSGKADLTAVLCYKASYAIELLHELWRVGLSVPRDLSVATFDDSWIVSHLQPPLTAVGIPMNDIARQACTLLIDMIENVIIPGGRQPGTVEAVTVDESLVVRESTVAPPAAVRR